MCHKAGKAFAAHRIERSRYMGRVYELASEEETRLVNKYKQMFNLKVIKGVRIKESD